MVITLHDEINILPWREIIRGHAKNFRTIGMMTYLHLWSRNSIKQADLILSVSEYARRQIAHYSGMPITKIVAIPHAPAPDLRRIDDANTIRCVRQRYGIDKPFVLADALKNPGVLARAWKRLPADLRHSNQVVFFSRRRGVSQVVLDLVSDGDALILFNPPREDLIVLYSQAQVFVFPSWIEGFGIPILEAMTCGTPVIASDRGAIPEVAGEAALLVDAEDDKALTSYLEMLLRSPQDRQRMIEQGYRRAAQFSWEQSARQVLECYRMGIQLHKTQYRIE